jgi:hypothetical protein
MPAMDANYLSAEFTACGQHFDGMGICTVEAGQDFSQVALGVQGYYQGDVRFTTDCVSTSDPLDSILYSNSNQVIYPLTGQAIVSCGISFVVSPQYPNEKNETFVIHSFEGELYIKVVPVGQKWLGFKNKVTAGANPSEVLQLPTAFPTSEVLFEGCGIKYDQVISAINGVLYVPLKAVLPTVPQQTCVMSGAYWQGNDAIRLTWMIDGYDSKFISLPIPNVSQSGNSLKVQGDDNTSVIALDAQYSVDNSGSFKFNPKVSHTLRLLTIGGRSMIGDYSASKGWTWIY